VHPLLKNPRGLLAYLSAWVLASCVLGAASAWQAPAQWPWRIAFLLPLGLAAGLAALSLYAVCRALPLRPARWMGALSRRAAAVALMAALLTGAAALWNATGSLWGREALVELTRGTWAGLFGLQLALLALATLMHDALLAQQAVQAAAAKEAEARLLAREMELKALRSQIDPHFLFNSLNSISALIPGDPAAARAMTIELARFFRQTLSVGARDRIRLEEELELVGHYLEIERRRLGEKLRVSIDVEEACRTAACPPLVLQPLVENAIKHGIRALDAGGQVEISARRSGGRLVLRVTNPVPEAAPGDTSGLGEGLRQLKSRLQAQYDETGLVTAERGPGNYTVQLSLPWQT
jgi:two-component system sensor histidine kinase AlgZ